MKKLLLLTSLVFFSFAVSAQKYGLTSPDGKLTAGIEIDNGIYAALIKGRNAVFKLGNISLKTYFVEGQNDEYRVQKVNRTSVNETVKPEIREKAAILVNSYNELEIKFRNKQAITFRLFNEGLAYRFSTSSKDNLTITEENLDLYLETSDSVRFQSSASF
ncbi:MAG: glycoside hydrolase family 97 protein, partial [Bacteroidetes bacterium]|nr:glycoside hydrolase family 97 protein [Bacteroidota bacterium]